MKEVFIICKMMEAEARAALASTGSAAEVIWMEKGLHARPDHLREAMQETIDRAEREFAPDRILLGYGFCGNALAGLRAHECELVLPRIDDCITLFIGSRERKAELEGGVGTMFQTSDWSDTDESVLSQKSRLYEDYDEDEAEELFQMMFGHYGRIGVLDAKIPIIFYFGDYMENGPQDIMSSGFWSMIKAGAVSFAEAYNAAGGDATVIDLPAIGITGNSHFMFQEMNNQVIADHIEAWLTEKGLN